jgi:hypothetical protein
MQPRAQHLEWCKKRALAYVDQGCSAKALESMFADLAKHPETRNHPDIETGDLLKIVGMLSTPQEVRFFIEGFN